MVFKYHDYKEANKVKEAASSFFGYASSWWDQDVQTRYRIGELQVKSWTEMKFIMRQRFAPRHCHRTLRKESDDVRSVKAVEKNFSILKQEQNQPSPIHQKSMKEKESVKRSTTTKEELENELLELLNSYTKPMKAKCALPSKSVKDKCYFPNGNSDFTLESEQACEKLILFKPVQPSSIDSFSQVLEEKSPEDAQKCSSSNMDMEQPASSTPEPLIETIPNDSFQKHCKEIDLVRMEPSLFVTVSAQDESRFGLENVKEFYVSKSVFDNMIPTFEKLTPETFLKPKGFLIDESHEFHSSLSDNEFNDISDLIRARTEPMLYKMFSNVKQSLRTSLCVSESFYECRNHLDYVSNVLGYKKKFNNHKNLFDSSRTFDVVSLVFVKAHTGQVKEVVSNTRKTKFIFKESQVKFRPHLEWLCPKAIKFKWKEKEISCLLTKGKFSNTLILSDFFKSCELEYYAPRKGIGTILMQDQKPITAFGEKDGGFLLGMTKSFKVMQDHFLWPHKKKGDVKRRCQSYVICKWTNTQPHGLRHSVLIPLHAWNEISIGLVELPRIRMFKDLILVIMNMFSKLFHFVSFHKTSVNLHHAHLIFEGITRLHEIEPSLSDLVFSNVIAYFLSVFNFNEALKLFRTESKFVWYKVISKMKPLLKFVLCAFKWSNVFSLVLVKILKQQVKKSVLIKRKICVVANHFGFRNWKYLRKLTSKLKSDEPLEALMQSSNDVHQANPQGKYNVSTRFKVADLFPFVSDEADLRTNLFQEGGDDMIMAEQLEREEGAKEQLEPEDVQGALEIPDGPITRSKAKNLKQAVSTLLIQAESNLSETAYPTTLVVIQAI